MLYEHRLVRLVSMRRPFKAIRRDVIETFERDYVYRLLERHAFDVPAVVQSSGLSRRRLLALVRKHGFDDLIESEVK